MGDKTSLGISENLEGLLCYFLGFITGILFLIVEKENKFVRFHAMQSTITFGALWIVGFVIGMIPGVNLLSPLLGLIGLVLWIFLMFKAFSGEAYKLPTIGDLAEKQLGN